MKNVFDIYKIIKESSDDEIYLDDVDNIDETYIEFSKAEIEKMLDEDINDEFGEIEICGEVFNAADILHQLNPEHYNKKFIDFCNAYDVYKSDGRYYAKADNPTINKEITESSNILSEEKTVPTVIKTDSFCDFDITIIKKDKDFCYQLKDTKGINKLDSDFTKCKETYNSMEAALEAAQTHVKKICIKNELESRKTLKKKLTL